MKKTGAVAGWLAGWLAGWCMQQQRTHILHSSFARFAFVASNSIRTRAPHVPAIHTLIIYYYYYYYYYIGRLLLCVVVRAPYPARFLDL